MNEQQNDVFILRNALAVPARTMTAVEIATTAEGLDLARELSASVEAKGRPARLLTKPLTGKAASFVETLGNVTAEWPPQQGALFVVDKTDAEDDRGRHMFWREMNLQRERLGALKCHLIFMLLPGSYHCLLTVADHLADWIPLKLHTRRGADTARGELQQMADFLEDDLPSPAVARDRLSGMEQRLAQAIDRGEGPRDLTRDFYLPMLRLALAGRDLPRARALAARIDPKAVPDADRHRFLTALCGLYALLQRPGELAAHADELLHIARERGDRGLEATGLFHVGTVAFHERRFDDAEKAYRKSLEITERQGNEHGAAGIYHQLGMIAQEQRDFQQAEKWYRKSLEITERQGNEHGAAGTYHQLGRIAEEQRDFQQAEKWYRKSLEITERQGNEHGAAITCGQLGILDRKRGAHLDSGRWFITAALGFLETDDFPFSQQLVADFITTLSVASEDEQHELRRMWQDSGLPALPEEDS